MALIKCKECGNKVATTAKACPKCGAEVTPEIVREAQAPKRTTTGTKLILVLLGVLAVVVAIEMANQQSEEERKAAAEQARVAALSPQARAAEEKKRVAVAAAAAAAAEKEKLLDAVRYTCFLLAQRSLKDPETARFDDYRTYYAAEQNGGIFLVQVKVRAKNSFNAMLNTVMDCRIRRDKKGNWTAVSLKQID